MQKRKKKADTENCPLGSEEKTVLLGLRRKLTAKGKRQLIQRVRSPQSQEAPQVQARKLGGVLVLWVWCPLTDALKTSHVSKESVYVCVGGAAQVLLKRLQGEAIRN